MQNLIRKYNGTYIEDWGSTKSPALKQFGKDFKKSLKNLDGISVVDFRVGHYDVSGFLQSDENGKYVYFSYNVPRGNQVIDVNMKGSFGGILIRTAESRKDFHGGLNNFVNFYEFENGVRKLLGE